MDLRKPPPDGFGSSRAPMTRVGAVARSRWATGAVAARVRGRTKSIDLLQRKETLRNETKRNRPAGPGPGLAVPGRRLRQQQEEVECQHEHDLHDHDPGED